MAHGCGAEDDTDIHPASFLLPGSPRQGAWQMSPGLPLGSGGALQGQLQHQLHLPGRGGHAHVTLSLLPASCS